MGRGRALRNFAMLVAVAVARVATAATPEIPARAPEPYAVFAFDNRSGVRSLDWLRVAIPFELAEKLEGHRKVRPMYGPLVLPEGPPPEVVDATSVTAFAKQSGASLVWAGWFKRAPDWDMVLTVQLWRVARGKASLVGEVTAKDDFKAVHAVLGQVIRQLSDKANVSVVEDDAGAIDRVPTDDYYAFTLFGRGLLDMHGLGDAPNFDDAEKTLKRSLFIDPDLAEAHRLLAELYVARERPARARGKYGFALDLRPGYYAAMAGQAAIDVAEGRLEEARKLYTGMVVQRPWNVGLRFELGKLLWELGDAAGALVELDRVIAVDPEHLPARRVLVLVHASRGAGPDLIAQLEAIAERTPDELEVKLDLGAAYASVGREKDAIAIYKRVVGQHPDHLQALKFLGDLYKRGGDLDGAIRYYRAALRANDRDPRPYFLLGRAYVEAGDDRAAKRIYRQALKFKKYQPETFNNLGSISYRLGRYGEARWYLGRAVDQRPKNPRFRYNYALVLSVLRELDDALGHIDVGLALAPSHVGLHYLRGVVLLRTGDADAATRSFERTLELEPAHADARHNLALLEQMRRRAIQGEITTELPQPAE